MSNTAIILAAGNGTRMKANKSKLLLEINGMTVIERTVKTFSKISDIDDIIVVVRESDIPLYEKVLSGYDISYCIGGSTRQESVSNAVETIDSCDMIIIHDGARPLVTEKEILNKYLLLFNEFFEKIYEYFQKGIDTKPAENFFFDTFFSNIDLKLDENKFLEWFQEQIVVAEDALIMM